MSGARLLCLTIVFGCLLEGSHDNSWVGILWAAPAAVWWLCYADLAHSPAVVSEEEERP
jgi:hypothetical protein